MKLTGQFGTYEIEDTPFNEAGAYGVLHRCSQPKGYVVKTYREPISDSRKIRQLLHVQARGREVLVARAEIPGRTPEASVNWPIDHMRNKGGDVTAVVLPAIPQRFWHEKSRPRTFSWFYLWSGDPPDGKTRIAVLIRLAEIFNWLDRWKFVHGDLSENNVVVAYGSDPGAYLIDCDGLQPTTSELPGCWGTMDWNDPRVSDHLIPFQDQQSDWYGLALAVYRGLFIHNGHLGKRDGTWPAPQLFPEDPNLRRLLQRSLGAPLDASTRAAPKEWVIALKQAFVRNGGWDAPALKRLDEMAGYTAKKAALPHARVAAGGMRANLRAPRPAKARAAIPPQGRPPAQPPPAARAPAAALPAQVARQPAPARVRGPRPRRAATLVSAVVVLVTGSLVAAATALQGPNTPHTTSTGQAPASTDHSTAQVTQGSGTAQQQAVSAGRAKSPRKTKQRQPRSRPTHTTTAAEPQANSTTVSSPSGSTSGGLTGTAGSGNSSSGSGNSGGLSGNTSSSSSGGLSGKATP